MVYESIGFSDEAALYVDGVKQTLTEPSPPTLGLASLSARGAPEFGDPASASAGIGGSVIALNASLDGLYNYWASFSDVTLTPTQIRNDLFEKGVLPSVTLSGADQATLQTSLDALIGSTRPNEALNIRVPSVVGDISLTADNITHDSLASVHIQWLGTGTLTYRQINNSNASIFSVPNGGTVISVRPIVHSITVLDATDLTPIEGARVYIEAGLGGDITEGDVIVNDVTDPSGLVTPSVDFTNNNQPFSGRVRKSTVAPNYKQSVFSGTFDGATLTLTILMVRDS